MPLAFLLPQQGRQRGIANALVAGHGIVKRHARLAAVTAGRGLFKGAALFAAFVLIAAAWWWDASLLITAADGNLRLIKAVSQELPFDWGSKAESALRVFGADRALLLVEAVALAKLAMLAVAYPFRRRGSVVR